MAFSTKTASGKFIFANDDSPQWRDKRDTTEIHETGEALRDLGGFFEEARQPRLQWMDIAIRKNENGGQRFFVPCLGNAMFP